MTLSGTRAKTMTVLQRASALISAVVFGLLISFGALPHHVHADAVITINDCAELQGIGTDVDKPLNGNYVLGDDIPCADTVNWNGGVGFEPIGTYYHNQGSPTSFTGTFDGQGHTISDLFINRPSQSNIGLFGVIDDGATVENFSLSNVNITGDWYVGAAAGGLVGHLENVHASGSVNGNRTAGGLVGQHVPIGNLDNSSPLVYTWNGTKYTYTDDVGDLLPRDTNGEDLAQIDKNALAPKDGKYSMKIAEEYNEIVYYDQLSLMTFDHQPGYSIVSPLFRNTTKNDLRTISDTPTNELLSCVDKYGHDCKDDLKSYDDKWSYKDSSKVNYWVMDFGDLSAHKNDNVQLVMRGARNYEETPESKLRTVQVKDQNGNWVEIYNKNDIGSDGSPRLRTIDLTGKFLSNNYQVKVGFDTLQANYFAIDTSPQVPVETHTYAPESVNLDFHGFTKIDRTHFNDHDYNDVSPEPATQFKNQYGKFTKYGDVTPLLQSKDDQYAIMRYGDQLNVEFPYTAPASGKERSFILNNQALYKHANLGVLGTKVDPIPYQGMGQYNLDTRYPNTPEHQQYLNTWNTREYVGNDNPTSSTIVDSTAAVDVTVNNCLAGGIVGYNLAKDIINTHASGNVVGRCDVGGIAGVANNGSVITQSSASGDVSSPFEWAGGLVGEGNQLTIDQSYSTSLVTGKSYVGGLAGELSTSSVTDSYSRGDVIAAGDSAGGIAGRSNITALDRTYSTGDVTSDGSAYVGGITGYFNLDNGGVGVRDSFATGTKSGDDLVAGLVGTYSSATGPVMANSFWNNTAADEASMPCYYYESSGFVAGDTNCTKIDNNVNFFKSSSNGPMSNWDFDTVWEQHAAYNDGFPCLTWDTDCSNSVDVPTSQTTLSASTDGTPILLSQSGCSSIDSAVSVKESGLQVQDAGYEYPLGLVNYTLHGCDLGVVTVNLTFTGSFDLSKVIIRKFNSNTNAFTTLNGNEDVSFAAITYNNKPALRVTLNINDGGPLDQDGRVDGKIVDPIGIAQQAVSVPNTGIGDVL